MASRLADATSPYLRAHADNPVAWFPWGPEAFAEARRRDVPVLISIGYSTCHWCHVMARESFADAATAADLDAGFVSIKVDREEHPDVDETYMAAAGAFTRNLGWPLTVFATPAGRTFYAGTYFPPEERAGLPSFRTILAAVREAWTYRRTEIERTADALTAALAGAGQGISESGLPTTEQLADAARRLAAREDPVHGGFGDAGAAMHTPKFPVVPALRFLQSRAIRQHAAEASAVADRALSAMAASPLRDRVDGGFFRYATRRDWTVPHYERMLTDNAGLVDVALSAGRGDLARAAAGFLIDTLQQPSGGFGAAQDSESVIDGARSEGGYYERDAGGRAALAAPAVDGKVITGWNGLAIAALARAAVVLSDDRILESARWAADAVLEVNTAADGRLRRSSLDEIPSRAAAVLEDYGLLAGGLTALALATGAAPYAETARELVDSCLSPDGIPRVPGGGDPVLTAHGTRAPAGASDGDHPSGIASIAAAAARLWLLGAGETYREAAAAIVRAHAAAALAEPLAHGAMLEVAALLAVPPRQLVVVTDDPAGAVAERARTVRADVLAILDPHAVRELAAAGFSLFEAKEAVAGPTAYDCTGFVCRLPATDPGEIED